MRILPFGPCLPVHCCCEPNVRLGWVPVPARRLTKPGPVHFVVGHHAVALWLVPVLATVRRLETSVEELQLVLSPAQRYQCEHGTPHYTVPLTMKILAVKSAHEPIDTWRKIPGFVEY